MIVRNDFEEFQHVAEEIDRRLFYVNLIIKRGEKGSIPVNESGIITIDDTKDEGYFGGELVHEAGHTVFDPITSYNWVTCVHLIQKGLSVDRQTAKMLGCIATDLIVGWKIKGDSVLNDYRRKSVEVLYDRFYKKTDPIRKELFGICKRMHGCKYEAETKLYDKVKEVFERNMTRKERYIGLAHIFLQFMEEEGVQTSEDRVLSCPLRVDIKEARRTAQQLLMISNDFKEAEEKIAILMDISELRKDRREILRDFFEAKARLVRMSIVFPKERTYKGVKVGSKRWKPEYGIKAIDIKRTVMKHGFSIPLVTTQMARVLPKFISSYEGQKLCDLVVSIDTSGSTGYPCGYMDVSADYEVIMFYALIDLAKRLDQRVGLTLWSDWVEYTTLPEVYDWRRIEELKGKILSMWFGAGTRIRCALTQARRYPEKLFFIFTDGEVCFDELIDVDNVIFFLIQPRTLCYEAFLKKYDKSRVIRVESLDRIPKVVVSTYVKLFKG